jgi:hypothetical protein
MNFERAPACLEIIEQASVIKLPQGRLGPPLDRPQPGIDQQPAQTDRGTVGAGVLARIAVVRCRDRIYMGDVHRLLPLLLARHAAPDAWPAL